MESYIKQCASTGNRTRVTRMATVYSTTRPWTLVRRPLHPSTSHSFNDAKYCTHTHTHTLNFLSQKKPTHINSSVPPATHITLHILIHIHTLHSYWTPSLTIFPHTAPDTGGEGHLNYQFGPVQLESAEETSGFTWNRTPTSSDSHPVNQPSLSIHENECSVRSCALRES